MKIAASACASGVGFQENPIAAASTPAMQSQSPISCDAPGRLRVRPDRPPRPGESGADRDRPCRPYRPFCGRAADRRFDEPGAVVRPRACRELVGRPLGLLDRPAHRRRPRRSDLLLRLPDAGRRRARPLLALQPPPVAGRDAANTSRLVSSCLKQAPPIGPAVSLIIARVLQHWARPCDKALRGVVFPEYGTVTG